MACSVPSSASYGVRRLFVFLFGLRLLLLLSLWLFDRLADLRPIWWRRFSGPLFFAATLTTVDRLRGKADPAVEAHGTGAAVANKRIKRFCTPCFAPNTARMLRPFMDCAKLCGP